MLLKLIFGWIMLDYVPKLRHVGNKMVSKIAFNIERPCFKKPCFFLGKTLFFEIQWVDVGTSSGIRPNEFGNKARREERVRE